MDGTSTAVLREEVTFHSVFVVAVVVVVVCLVGGWGVLVAVFVVVALF